jgi:hypothetical protein
MGRSLRRYWLVFAVVAAALLVGGLRLVADRLTPAGADYSRTNYSCVEDGLYLGGYLAQPPPGTRAVLNVCESKDPYEAEVHRWEPIHDAAPAPSLDWLRRQVEFIDAQHQAGRPVFVHCHAGISRSVMVVAAYLMARDGRTRDEALAFLRTLRPSVGPNPAFLELLREWEQSLKKPAGGAPPGRSS